jgi:hypothetical protein
MQQAHPIIEQELLHKQQQKQQYQPQQQPRQQPRQQPQQQPQQMNHYDENQLLPSDKQLSDIPNTQPQIPDFNQMYQNNQQQSNEQNNFNNSNIQASNDSLDNMFGGSAW